MTDSLKTYRFEPKNGQPPKYLVILLHGVGADGQDLIGLAPYLAESIPDALFLAPDAPFPCDMAPFGRQWFSLREWTPESLRAGLKQVEPIVQSYIDEQLQAAGLDDSKLALVGFSQGTMTALYAGPHRKQKIAGILGYSGALVWDENTDFESLQKFPVHLIHGDLDDVVPVEVWHMGQQALKHAGYPFSGEVIPGLPHSINNDGLRSGGRFLQTILR